MWHLGLAEVVLKELLSPPSRRPRRRLRRYRGGVALMKQASAPQASRRRPLPPSGGLSHVSGSATLIQIKPGAAACAPSELDNAVTGGSATRRRADGFITASALSRRKQAGQRMMSLAENADITLSASLSLTYVKTNPGGGVYSARGPVPGGSVKCPRSVPCSGVAGGTVNDGDCQCVLGRRRGGKQCQITSAAGARVALSSLF